uniref:C2H2-type domain-containing protein n=1 Tax=Salix viminalis TaxID=40686 RepID=A0A6N2MQI8_SALVM
MDSQDPRKNPSLTPGHESHGVYVCNKCGWPFPNPHPSARHRRAHKKICGTLKGYKFVDSEETPLSALSDDDRGSDEDPKTPSPKGLGRGINEKGSGGVGSRSNRSEDDVFTDAIAEFPESGSSSVTGEHTKDVKEPEINLEVNKAAAQSSEDGSITVISPPPSNSADHIHMQSTEVPVINLSESPQESLDHDLNATIASMSRTLTDFRGEQSGFEHSHDNRSSARDPIPIELETQTDASQEKKSVTVEDLPKTDAKGNEETKSEGQLLDVVDSTNDNAKDVSEVASKSQKMEDVTSQPVPAAEVPQLKEGGYTDDLASGMSLNDHYPEVKSVEPAHSSISTAQIKGDAPQEIDSAVYANSTVTYDNKGEGNENVHVLVVPNDLTVVSDAENMVKGFKDLEGGKLPKLMNVDSFDVFNNVKDSDLKDNPQVLNSRSLTEDTETSASDMHVLIDNLEPKDGTSQHIVEEFLDEAEADVPQISEVSVADVVTGDLEKSISVHSPEENVPRDHCDTSSLTSSIEHATKVIPDTNTVVVPSDAEVRQTKLVGMDGTGNDEKDKIESSEIGVKDIFAENTIPSFKHVSIPSEQADQRNSLLGDVKATGLEEGKRERCNVSEIVTEGDSLSGLGEENLLRKTKTIPESAVNVESRFTSENEINVCEANLPQHASIPSDQADQRNRLHGDVIAAGLEEGKIERCNVSEIVTEGDSVSGLGEENLLRNPKTTPESAVNVESRFTSENEINVCEVKLPHHEHTDIGRVLDPQESRKEPESNGMANQQAEHAGEDSTAAESDSGGGDVEVLRKSSEEKMVREPLVSPSEPSSTLQNSSPVAHNQARDFPGVASGNTPESLPDEGVNYFATQQVVASATDFSADSISQTDSLEGHWGSVSVLSTQSDIPAILDAEPLPSNGSRASEAEEATLKKPIAASETEHADKSDIFDPPSVTALIEPRDVVNQKAAASEIQTTWNPQQPKAASVQAGLSPSITDVSNEWQGRKKHEEIMAKVTDWSTGKQHTPLKNLLGEASMETRFKSLNAKEIPVEKDGPAAKDNGSLPKTVSSILAPQEPEGEPAKLEEKAWSSPARYPADIKREKRRVRGRPYWAQFVCCSSVN